MCNQKHGQTSIKLGDKDSDINRIHIFMYANDSVTNKAVKSIVICVSVSDDRKEFSFINCVVAFGCLFWHCSVCSHYIVSILFMVRWRQLHWQQSIYAHLSTLCIVSRLREFFLSKFVRCSFWYVTAYKRWAANRHTIYSEVYETARSINKTFCMHENMRMKFQSKLCTHRE